MNRGDIVLYRSSGKWYERAIVLATGGPFVHVAIATSDKQVIAAGTRGINYFPFSYDAKMHTIVSLVPEHVTPLGIETGLQWALQQIGKRYDWLDIVYQAIKFLNPNTPFRFYRAGTFDCSDYVTRYLQHAGVELPEAFQDPFANSPNDIGRIFNLLPPRKA